MKRSAPKNPRLRERLQSLERELSQVERSIDQLDRAVRTPDREAALERLKVLTERKVEEPAPPKRAAAPLPASPRKVAEPESEPVPGPDDLEEEAPRADADRRFASYFVTGSLHSVRPLRTERRIQRNKALVMMVVAAVLLYGLVSMLFF